MGHRTEPPSSHRPSPIRRPHYLPPRSPPQRSELCPMNYHQQPSITEHEFCIWQFTNFITILVFHWAKFFFDLQGKKKGGLLFLSEVPHFFSPLNMWLEYMYYENCTFYYFFGVYKVNFPRTLDTLYSDFHRLKKKTSTFNNKNCTKITTSPVNYSKHFPRCSHYW